MRIAIVGSRDYPCLDHVKIYVQSLRPGTIVITGGARGVDRTAEEAARARGLEVVIFRADWTRHGKAAGMLRNTTVVAAANKIVAFWDGRSPGTADAIRKAEIACLPVTVIRPQGGVA